MKHAVRGLWVMILRNRRAVRDALVILGLGRAFVYYAVQGIHPWEWLGTDARAYWRVDLVHPYVGSGVFETSTYLYPPAFAQFLSPLWVLPFPIFYALWTVMLVGLLVWLVRPWPWALAIFALPISYELFVGQIHLLIAAIVVLGFRRPALWAFPLVTKVTPGVGVIWFAVRREWRNLAIALGTAGVIVAISFALAPGAWLEWISFVIGQQGRGEALPLRLVVAVAIVAFAGLTDRRWLVPVGVWIAFPVVYVETFVVLLAIIRIVDEDGGLRFVAPTEGPGRAQSPAPMP